MPRCGVVVSLGPSILQHDETDMNRHQVISAEAAFRGPKLSRCAPELFVIFSGFSLPYSFFTLALCLQLTDLEDIHPRQWWSHLPRVDLVEMI